MEKKINEDLSRITKFVNNMTKDVKNNKKVNLKDNKLKKLQKELNIHKVKLIASKKRTQSGGTDEKMIQELVQYATKIDIFSSKLENVIGNLSTISESIGNFPIQLSKSTFDQIIKNSKANTPSKNAVRTNISSQTSVKGQRGGVGRESNAVLGQLNMNYIQSIVYMSEVVKYISQWINTVNTIITNNQLGLSDKCLEKSREMMESLAKLAQSQQKTDVVVPQGSLVRQ